MISIKKMIPCVLCGVMCLTLTGCNSNPVSEVSKFLEAGGREYGKTTTNEMNEEQKNSFFALKATEAYRHSSLGGYVPDEGYDFLAVKIFTRNIFTESIPMSCYDYNIRWGDGENDFAGAQTLDTENGYGYDDYPENTTLAIGREKEGYVYFSIPKDATDLRLEYIELYEDDFEGSTFYINLGNPAFSPDDIAPSDIDAEEGVYTAGLNEELESSYFRLKVTETYTTSELAGVAAEEGYTYMAAHVSVTNTSDEAMLFTANSYMLIYGDGEDDAAMGGEIFTGNADDYPAETELAADGTLDGWLYFMVPSGAEELSLCTMDFSDENYGNLFIFDVSDPPVKN